MRIIRLIVEYDGANFHGWQVQTSVRTVQGELEDAVKKMTGQHCRIRGASRTDAGVHALGQVAGFSTSSKIKAQQFAPGLTALSGHDVAVVAAEEGAEDFSARHDARGKTYTYTVWNRRAPSPTRRGFTWHVRHPLDLAAMREATAALIGERDFAAFRSAGCDQPTTVRNMKRIDIADGGDGTVALTFEATAFLQHMVRILTGTLVQVGLGRLTAEDVATIRDSKKRQNSGPTAPPQGLCLIKVHY